MAVSVNLEKGLDKAWENKSLDEILAAPPSALAGLTEKHDEILREALNIKTIADLGSNKYFALAGVLVSRSATSRADHPTGQPRAWTARAAAPPSVNRPRPSLVCSDSAVCRWRWTSVISRVVPIPPIKRWTVDEVVPG